MVFSACLKSSCPYKIFLSSWRTSSYTFLISTFFSSLSFWTFSILSLMSASFSYIYLREFPSTFSSSILFWWIIWIFSPSDCFKLSYERCCLDNFLRIFFCSSSWFIRLFTLSGRRFVGFFSWRTPLILIVKEAPS